MNISRKKFGFFEAKNIFRHLVLMWYFSHKYLFVVLLLVTTGYGVWFWKDFVYEYHWTEAEKLQYINMHAKETNFKEEKFRSVLDEISAKEKSFHEERSFRDIFYEQ